MKTKWRNINNLHKFCKPMNLKMLFQTKRRIHNRCIHAILTFALSIYCFAALHFLVLITLRCKIVVDCIAITRTVSVDHFCLYCRQMNRSKGKTAWNDILNALGYYTTHSQTKKQHHQQHKKKKRKRKLLKSFSSCSNYLCFQSI